MVTIGKYNGDINCWGLSHNDFHRGLMQVPENIDVQLNSTNNNNPLVLKANSMFFIWGSSGITISANSSGNASYPAGSTYDYFRPSAVYTSADFAPLWTSTSISSTGGNGIYYMVCKGGVDTTSVGSGTIDYLMSTVFTPEFNRMMCGWYGTTAGSTEWRALGRFIMTVGVMSRACVFETHIKSPGYVSNINVFSTGTNVYISPLTVAVGENKAFTYLQEVNLTAIAGLTASTWYAVGISETDGTIVNSSMAGGWTGWTISGNQLNAYSIYNSAYNYCRAARSAVFYRILSVFLSDATPDAITYCFNIYNRPKSIIRCTSNQGQSINNGGAGEPIDYEDIIYDLNSNITIGASWKCTAIGQQTFSFNCVATFDTQAGWAAGELGILTLLKNGVLFQYLIRKQMMASVNPFYMDLQGSGKINLTGGDYFNINVFQNMGSDIALIVTPEYNCIDITEIQ